ncbi:MAG: DUF2089 family protein [candidate division Zixibacteria bacterium]|nr:DUF2089 family protein [candidate division Zixibacteria bacterium]
MAGSWNILTEMTKGKQFVVERIRLRESKVAIEGEFKLPPLARLSDADQVFVVAFIQSDGSIKQTEKLFGVSYPTIKSRLKRIAAELDFVEVEKVAPKQEVLDLLDKGEITVEEALERLK